MAESSSASSTISTENINIAQELRDIRTLLWGSSIKIDTFRRWSQGEFMFLFTWQYNLHKWMHIVLHNWTCLFVNGYGHVLHVNRLFTVSNLMLQVSNLAI